MAMSPADTSNLDCGLVVPMPTSPPVVIAILTSPALSSVI